MMKLIIHNRIRMKARTAIILGIFGLLILAVGFDWLNSETQAATGINQQINYQGKLNDANGVQVDDATYKVKFVIYDAATSGNCLWTAVGDCDTSDYGTTTVTTVNGIFSTALGGTGHNSLATSSIDFNTDSLYLGVTIRGTTASPVYDSEMTPRKRITSSVYAFNADLIDGIHATSTAAVANYLLSLDASGNLDLFDQGVSSTQATTTVMYFQPQASAPDAIEGRTYYDSNENKLYVYDGTTWQDALAGGIIDWELVWGDDSPALRPTSTNDLTGLFVNASSTISTLRVDDFLRATTSLDYWYNASTTLMAVDISDDTDLTVSSPIILTDDDISFDFSTANTWTGANIFQGDFVANNASSTIPVLWADNIYATSTEIGTLTLTNALTVPNGGTSLSSYTQGDIIYSDGANSLAALDAGTAGYVLTTGGAGANPSWTDLTTLEAQQAWHYDVEWDAIKPTSTKGIYVTASSTIAADFRVDGSATTTGTLEITGYASTTNLVLADGASNLGTYYDVYVSGGNLFFNGTQISGSDGLSFWQYNAELEGAISPTSTASGIFVTASSTIATLRVDDFLRATTSLDYWYNASTTLMAVDISDDTDLTVSSPIILTDDDISFDFSTANTWTGANIFQGDFVANNASSTIPVLWADNIYATSTEIGTLTLTNALTVPNGGTGATSLTDGGILLGSGAGAITPLGQATNGQLPIGSTGADPVLATLTAGSGIDITNDAGSITIATTGLGQNDWEVVWGDDSPALKPTSTNDATGLFVNASSTIAADFRVDGSATTTGGLSVDGTTLIVQADTSRVGIGTASPISSFHVAFSNSDTTFGNSTLAYSIIQNTNTTNNTYGGIGFATQNSEGSLIFGAGISTLYTNHTAGSVTAELGFFTRDSGVWSEKVRIDSTGKVGIGITDPDQALDIIGNASTSQAFYAGTDLYVGQASDSGNDVIYFDAGGQTLTWDDSNDYFAFGTDLYVSGYTTTTGTLEVSGYASTTNLVLADGASNLGTYYDIYVSSGNLFFDGTQISGSDGLSFWQYNSDLEGAISPTSTTAGIFITASSTIAADFRVDGNATTTGSLYVSGTLGVATTSPYTSKILAVTGDTAIDGSLTIDDNLTTVGDLRVDGGDIGLTADTDLIQIAANALTINGTITVPNNLYYKAKATGGTAYNLIGMETDNFTHINAKNAASIIFDINGTEEMRLDTNGQLGIGITPVTHLDIDSNSNSQSLRIRGAAGTVEIADIFVAANGALQLSTTPGTGSTAYIDLRSEDNAYGIIIRESDGTGTGVFGNIYVVDATPDYMELGVRTTAGTYAIKLDDAEDVTIGQQLFVPNIGTGMGSDVVFTGDDEIAVSAAECPSVIGVVKEMDCSINENMEEICEEIEMEKFQGGILTALFTKELETEDILKLRTPTNKIIIQEDKPEISYYKYIRLRVNGVDYIPLVIEPTPPQNAEGYYYMREGERYTLTFDVDINKDDEVYLIAKGYYEITDNATGHYRYMKIMKEKTIDKIKILEAKLNDEPLVVADNSNLDAETLTVQQAITFYGTITVIGEAGFEHKVVFKEDVEIEGKLYVSEDQAGTAMIPAGATSTEIVFAGEYEVVPKVVANLADDDEETFVNWKIIRKTITSFTLLLQTPVEKNISFDWIALATKSAASQPPVIDNFITSRDQVGLDIPVELWAQVSDPDTEEPDLSYTWNFEPNVGKLSGNTGLVYWTVAETDSNTDVTITVTVSDGQHSVSESKVVRVIVGTEEEEPFDPAQGEPTIVLGCTDELALNYNPEATEDDGLCEYPPSVAGEAGEIVVEEPPTSTSTEPTVVLGCTDIEAENYDETATEDNGSCTYPEPIVILGCMDETALNYNSEATEDDGLCEYPEPEPIVEDINSTDEIVQGDGVVEASMVQ